MKCALDGCERVVTPRTHGGGYVKQYCSKQCSVDARVARDKQRINAVRMKTTIICATCVTAFVPRTLSKKIKFCSLKCQERGRKPRDKHKRKVVMARYTRKKWRTTEGRLAMLIRNRVFYALKKRRKPASLTAALGCTAAELKTDLESKFLDGMSWDNWGRAGWHIDHIKPLNNFDLTNPDEFNAACHYTNLQPLWAIDNLRKGSKPWKSSA